MEHVGEFSNTSAIDVIGFIKEVLEKFPSLHDGIVQNLLTSMMDIKAKKIFRGALWILGEYCTNETDIKDALRGIRKSLGELPILDTEKKLHENDREDSNGIETVADSHPRTTTRILADGTYATETALTGSQITAKSHVATTATKPPLRGLPLNLIQLMIALILDGDYYLTTILASTLTKLVIRFSESHANDLANSFRAEAMLIMSSIIRIGQSQFVKTQIDEDSIDRIISCFRALVNFKQTKAIEDAFLKETKLAYTTMLSADEKRKNDKAQEERNKSAVQVDDVIYIRQLSKKKTDNKVVDEV
jgi:coatomer subunit beta